jgi:hypothetical protein
MFHFEQTSKPHSLYYCADDGEDERLDPDKGWGRFSCLFLAVSQTQSPEEPNFQTRSARLCLYLFEPLTPQNVRGPTHP